MTNRQDDSGALRELVAKWRHNPKSRATADDCIRDDCADELEHVLRMRALSPQGSEPDGVGDAVAFRYFRQVTNTGFAWSGWLAMSELHHYGPTGDLVKGPAPEWKVEYAYATPAPAQQAVTEQGGAQGGEAADPLLDAPARIGGVRFGVGVHWSTVIRRAQQEYKNHDTRPAIAPQATPAAVDALLRDARNVVWRVRHNAYATGWKSTEVYDALLARIDAALAAPPAEGDA